MNPEVYRQTLGLIARSAVGGENRRRGPAERRGTSKDDWLRWGSEERRVGKGDRRA